MSRPVSHGNDPERLRAVAEGLSREAERAAQVGEQGRSMIGVLEEGWAGPDLEVFVASWGHAEQQADSAAQHLKSYAQRLVGHADEQDEASGGGAGGGPFAGTRAEGEVEVEDGRWGLPSIDLPSWGDVTDFVGDLKDKAVNTIDEWTERANEWWRDNVADSWLGRQVQLRLSQGSYWLGEGADWLRDSPIGRMVPLSPSLAYIADMGSDTLDSWSKYVNDPKGTFLEDWESSGWLGRAATLAGVIPIGRLLKKPADDLDDGLRRVLRQDPPGWVDDFTERAAKKDSSDPMEAAQGRLNERANRYVDRYDLDDPEDVWDQSKIDPRRRGIVVEAAQGGNLPGSYRTWDRFEVTPDGRNVATSIKSMDPSLPSYSTGNGVESTLRGYVDDITAATPQNRGGVSIDPDDLDGRVLEVVTPPGGFTADQLEQLHRARAYADTQGVDIVVKEYP